jgi:hypothetical protein
VRWSEERYVKLYTRKTVTWHSWPWESKALLPLFLQVCDGAGLFERGRCGEAEAMAMVTGLPLEVAQAGVEGLVATETLVRVPEGLLMPNFLEAQEATKSDALRKRDQRERAIAKARIGIPAESGGTVSRAVTESHAESRAVPLQPSPAQPSPLKASAKVKAPSLAQQLWAWAQDRRAEKGLETEAPWSVVQLNAKLKPKLEHHGRPALEAKYRAYLAVEKHKALTPPWAFAMFIACADSLPTVTAVTEEPRSRSL